MAARFAGGHETLPTIRDRSPAVESGPWKKRRPVDWADFPDCLENHDHPADPD
jgi:hypothetical protein